MIDFHGQLKLQYPTKDYIPVVYESAELQDNLEHSGGITISWNASTDDEIPMGAYVTYGGMRYILLEPYAPNKASAVPHYRYEPQFKHPQNMLDRIPFWIKSLDASGTPINLQTTSFTGYPHTIAKKLVDFLAEYANDTGDTFFADTMGLTYDESTGWSTSWKYDIPGTLIDNVIRSEHVIITVGFDGCSIKSAANAIADAMGCNVFWDWSTKTIRFVVGSTIQGEAYNCFHVLGGTTNMGKSVVSGGFAAVTQRLTLPEPDNENTLFDINSKSYALLKGSIISAATEDGIRLTTDLIFDEIYPKQELFIKSARQRLCYCTDENGEFIVDNVQTGALKMFAKWYLTFATSRNEQDAGKWPEYEFEPELLIQDQPLGLLFQADYKNPENMSSLVGQQFELTYYPTEQTEHDRNDVSSSFTVKAGEFFVAVKAVGEVLLPTTVGSLELTSVEYAYSTRAGFPTASEGLLGKKAIARNEGKIYRCSAPAQGFYDWIPTSDTISDGDTYIANHGNLGGTSADDDTLSDTPIAWNEDAGVWQYASIGMFPCIGDKVTLVNMALSDEQIGNAKDELFDAAKEIIAAMTLPSGEYSETVILGKSKDNTGHVITSVSVGEETIFERGVDVDDRKHGPVVTQIQQNLDTGIMQVTVGSWTRKTKTGGTVDKLETVTVSSSSPTTGGDSYSDGSIGSGGGYGGTSGKETETINQTVLKPDSLFLASLGNTIDAVSCDADGKVRIASNIYTRIQCRYGMKNVTSACTVAVHTLPPYDDTDPNNVLYVRLFLEESSSAITQDTPITETDTTYDLTETKNWLRINIPKDYDMNLLQDKLEQMFIIEHPAYLERNVSIVIQAMREGDNGESAINCYLENVHEDMLYCDDDSTNGGRLLDAITSQAHLFDGDDEKTNDVTWEISDDNETNWGSSVSTNATASISNTSGSKGLLTITGLVAQKVKIKVRAEYPANSGEYYYTDFTSYKRGGDNYKLEFSPDVVSCDLSDFTNVPIAITGTRTNILGISDALVFGESWNKVKISETSGRGFLRLFVTRTRGVAPGHVARMTDQVTSSTFTVEQVCAENDDEIFFELRKYTTETGETSSTVFMKNIPITRQGEQGLQGCVIRVSEWQKNQEYRNDEDNKTVTIGYIDVVGVESSSAGDGANYGYAFYRCKETHISSSQITTSDTTKWEALTNVGPIFTSFLVAKYAYIKFGTGNQFVITEKINGEDEIQAGMKGGPTGQDATDSDKLRFWAGSTTEDNMNTAPFRVYHDGSAYMTNAHVAGEIEANTGHIGGSQGWAITAKNLQSGTAGDDASMRLSTENFSFSTESGSTVRRFTDLRFSVGSKFGIRHDGTLLAQGAKFFDGLSTYNDFVEITESITQGNYTWRGIAIKFKDASYHDLATLGARVNASLKSYGRLVLTRREQNGDYPTSLPVEISAEDGSAKFEGEVEASKFHDTASMVEKSTQTVNLTADDYKVLLTYVRPSQLVSHDITVYVPTSGTNGQRIWLRKTNNNGIVYVRDSSDNLVQQFEFPNGWRFIEYYNGVWY